MLWDAFIRKRLGAGANARAIQLDSGQGAGDAAGGDQNIFRAHFHLAIGVLNHNPARTYQPSMTVVAGNFVFLEQPGYAARQTRHDFIFAPKHRGEFEFYFGQRNTMQFESVASLGKQFARFKQRLAGNAPDAQARSAKRFFFFDTTYAQPQLRVANGSD